MVVIAMPTIWDDLAIITNMIINKIPMMIENGNHAFL